FSRRLPLCSMILVQKSCHDTFKHICDENTLKKSVLVSLPSVSTDVCTLDPVTGPCRGEFERYFYNFKKGRCEIFIYGGCFGNQNNFETEKECLQRCRPH
uniref:BPTI/Kunitz inhibitor domain-containing protein n=1 Tax=Oryzias sinensis TaxID=183150 RepID=A0A8C7WYZ9_9TELE